MIEIEEWENVWKQEVEKIKESETDPKSEHFFIIFILFGFKCFEGLVGRNEEGKGSGDEETQWWENENGE